MTGVWLGGFCCLLKGQGGGSQCKKPSNWPTWLTVSAWGCIGLSALSLLPPGAGFRTTTGVHLHTGFKTWLRCDPSVIRGPLETEAGEDAVPGNTRSLWQLSSSTSVRTFVSLMETKKKDKSGGIRCWANEEAVFSLLSNWSPEHICASLVGFKFA